MKKLFFNTILSGSFFCLLGILAQAQTCPKMTFSYDASGNRVEKKLIYIGCRIRQPLSADSAETARPLVANIYPNPSQDKINIELQKEETETQSTIFLYDLSGKEVYSTVTSSLQVQIDVSMLGAGTYLLKIVRGKEYTTYNISKN